nr:MULTISPECIES: hypothetical protein [Methanosarcina]
MDFEDLPASSLIRGRKKDQFIKMSWQDKCRINDVRAIGCTNYYSALSSSNPSISERS